MTATPVLSNARDVICGSSLVACDGSLLDPYDGKGTQPLPAQILTETPIGMAFRQAPDASAIGSIPVAGAFRRVPDGSAVRSIPVAEAR